jgi:hypothetical protein
MCPIALNVNAMKIAPVDLDLLLESNIDERHGYDGAVLLIEEGTVVSMIFMPRVW